MPGVIERVFSRSLVAARLRPSPARWARELDMCAKPSGMVENDAAGAGRWLIYGANGYTGRLCAERAVTLGMRPTLAGRNEPEVRAVAEELDLPWKSFSLSEDEVDSALASHSAVLHCAGPFSATSEPMLAACLRTRTHYLDITGEIDVLETVLGRRSELVAVGVVALPGVGFDVVPTDCLAASLAEALPGSDRLELAFAGGAGFSAGTLKTSLEGVRQGVRARRGGRIVTLDEMPTLTVPFRDREREVVALSWGDVSSAYHSTGIANITCFAPKFGGTSGAGKGALRSGHGPDAAARAGTRMHVWGRVQRPDGRWMTGAIDVPEGYTLTAITALECVREVLAGAVKAGAWTPSRAFGPDFITRFPGVERVIPLDAG